LLIRPTDPLIPAFEVLGGCRENQQRQPSLLRIAYYVIEPLSDRFRAPQIMVLLEQPVAAFYLVAFEQSNLKALQDILILGAGAVKFFAHAPEPEKSEGDCPAKRVYALPLNYLPTAMYWRWVNDVNDE
jgi:hypothetical protein